MHRSTPLVCALLLLGGGCGTPGPSAHRGGGEVRLASEVPAAAAVEETPARADEPPPSPGARVGAVATRVRDEAAAGCGRVCGWVEEALDTEVTDRIVTPITCVVYLLRGWPGCGGCCPR